MSTISTWHNLLFPDAHVAQLFLWKFHQLFPIGTFRVEGSTFAPQELKLRNLPSCHMHLVQDLPFQMSHHLRRILEENYTTQAEATGFMLSGTLRTPLFVFDLLRFCISDSDLYLESDAEVRDFGSAVYRIVRDIYYALTENTLAYKAKPRTNHSIVITDRAYALTPDDTIRILWENKSPDAFDSFVGQLEHDIMNCGSRLEFSPVHTTRYHGYKATLAKVRVAAYAIGMSIEPTLQAFLPHNRS